ncbi:DNA packaging protein [Paracoccus limosus]|uniref:DNA packaging protein n=1 Tax=Paracoccus limosus TaxID=913252 RepID=A0A844H4N2_9RHOB|nr:terminase small subunit [Paracoccus limosus]MTH35762.1 DNA packaging protein [Paracoccus limosus]
MHLNQIDDESWILDLNEPAAPQNVLQVIPAEMTEAELSSFLGITASRTRTLARDGALVKSGRGRFDVRASVLSYTARMREAAGRAGNPAAGADPDALKAEKLRLTRAQADKEEARVQRERGELVEAAAVTREWASILRDLRNALLAVPSRCGAGLPHLTATDVATIDNEILRALEGLGHAG